MLIKQLVQFFSVDATNLSFKGKFLAILSGAIAMFMVAFITREFNFGAAYPIIVSSIGASAALLFIVPHSPLAQPWALVGGQLVSAFVGMTCAIYIPDAPLSAACAVGGSFLAMLLLRCLHPPGASTALAPLMGGAPLIATGYYFVLVPVGINVAVILVMALILNRYVQGINYPVSQKNTVNTRLAPDDIKQALKAMNTFIDVTEQDLNKLLNYAEQYRFKRVTHEIHCVDFMEKNVMSIKADLSIDKAWRLMYSQQLKALPVIDDKGRVIGMITWSDFFKFVNIMPYENFIKRFLLSIQQIFKKRAKKLKIAGDIMSTEVSVLSNKKHLADAIALMSMQGHRQIPIVDNDNRLVGMMYQANLIETLYKLQLLSDK